MKIFIPYSSFIRTMIFCVILLSSCQGLQNDIDENISTRSIVPSATVSATRFTIEPTDIATLTPLRTPTILSKEEKQALILKLLDSNAGCALPCWWGITPGVSTWNNTKELLEGQGFVIGEAISNDDLSIYGIIGDLSVEGVKIYDGFGESNGVVEVIAVQAVRNDARKFQQAFKNYSVKNILDTLGIPSRIWLEGHEGDKFGYRLWIFYDSQGILLRYSGLTEIGTKYHICPTFNDDEMTTLDIFLKGQQYKSSLESVSGYDEYQREYIHSLPDVSISVQAFYELFSGDSTDWCFDVSNGVFPP